MLTTYFGEFTTGRLGRLAYLGHYLLLVALMFVAFMAVGAVIGVQAGVLGADPEATEAAIDAAMARIGPLEMVLFGIVALIFSLASLNINAKRFRDIGLPGGWSLLVVFVLAIAVSLVFGETVSNLFGLVVLLALLLVPGGTVGGAPPD